MPEPGNFVVETPSAGEPLTSRSEEQAALEAFVVDNGDLETLEGKLSEFNVFEAIGAVRQELRHSDFLAFLLDPAGTHGLGPAFLVRFLKAVLAGAVGPDFGAVDVDVADFSGAVVEREWKNADILVRADVPCIAVVIENKIGSGEHDDQLQRYWATCRQELPHHRAVGLLLTPEGERPSDDKWLAVGYSTVADVIDGLLKSHGSRLRQDVRVLMSHYKIMLRRYIVADSDVAKLCEAIYARHKAALDLIFEHRPDSHSKTAAALRQLIESSVGRGICPDSMGKTYLHFSARAWEGEAWQETGRGWTPAHNLLVFEFQNVPRKLSLVLYVGPGDASARDAVFGAFSEARQSVPGVTDKLTGTYTRVYRKKWCDHDQLADLTEEEVFTELTSHWERFLKDDLPRIVEVTRAIRWSPQPSS